MIDIQEINAQFDRMETSNEKWLFAKNTYVSIWKSLKVKYSNGWSLDSYYNYTLDGDDYIQATKQLYALNEKLYDYLCSQVPQKQIEGVFIVDYLAIAKAISEMRDTYDKYLFAKKMSKVITDEFEKLDPYSDYAEETINDFATASRVIFDYMDKAKYKTLLVM